MNAELAARRTAAAAVLGDYRAALASAPLTKPPGREWMFRLADALGMLLDGLADDDEPEADEIEPYCTACGAAAGIFQGHGGAWRHWRGEGTAESPVELFDAGHVPVVAWRPAREAEEARRLDAIRALLARFDWQHDDRQYALETVERIAGGGAS